MTLQGQVHVQVEKKSNILRRITVKVPAKVVQSRFDMGLREVAKTAKLKGFRPGAVPVSVVKQFYGDDVRHRLFHSLIDESFQEAIRSEKLKAVGRPSIETPDHKTGEGEHDHTLHEDKDLNFIATVEVLPDLEIKGYTGIALTREKVDVSEKECQDLENRLLDSQAQLEPAAEGHLVKKGNHVDMKFEGGLVTKDGVEKREGMSGSRVLEVGTNQLVDGFEDELVGMKAGETKTFRIKFPKDFYEKDLAGQNTEFTVTINDVKLKNLPTLDDDLAKQMGYESVSDLRTKAKAHLISERQQESDRKIKSDLLTALMEKNPFDCPSVLIEAQARALAQDVGQNLKQQGADEATLQQILTGEMESIKKKAEGQVRASLIIEAIAKKEGFEVKPEEMDAELSKMAENMKVDLARMKEFYQKNPNRLDDLEFRIREDKTVKFLLDKAKIK